MATFNITLPKNTVGWFYSFTTSRAEKPKVSIGLLSQLTRFYDPTGLSAMATNAALCSWFDLGKQTFISFVAKQFLACGLFGDLFG